MFYWFLYDVNGNIASVSRNTPPTSDDVHDGYSMLGPYTDPLDATTQDAFTNPNHYTVLNGSLTLRSNVDSLKLQAAQQSKIAQLRQSLENSIATFQSNALGTTNTYLADAQSMTFLQAEYAYIRSSDYKGETIPYYTKEQGRVAHTGSQLAQVFLDGRSNATNQYAHFDSLYAQVKSATTVDAVNAITW